MASTRAAGEDSRKSGLDCGGFRSIIVEKQLKCPAGIKRKSNMKKSLPVLSVFSLIAFCALAQEKAPVKVRVLKDNSNLRARAALNVEVAGQVAAGQELAVKSMDLDWVEVYVPTNIDFWVLGDYLKDGQVVCRQKVNVRAGPGLNFTVVGQLNNGESVSLRGIHADWAKIAPPESCSLWISRPLVEIIAPEPPPAPARVGPVAAPQPSPAAARAPEKTPVLPVASPAVKTASPAAAGEPGAAPEETNRPAAFRPPDDLDLIPDVGQGQVRQYEGTLKSRNYLARSPSDFRLVTTEPGGQPKTICFVKGNRSQLKALMFRELTIVGRQYWVHNCRYPVIVPEKIILK